MPYDQRVSGLLFDKDGTLFDFQLTWGGWATDLMLDLADGDVRLARALAERAMLDMDSRRFLPGSPVIAGTTAEAAQLLLPLLPNLTHQSLVAHMADSTAQIPPVEAVPLAPFLSQLKDAGFVLGVATNDNEASARRQLSRLAAEAPFDFIAGYDSGFGAKPAPGPCFAFAEAMELDPEACAMIGDSTHDLGAGRAAGMVTIAVLTGVAGQEELGPHADVVLDSIADLPAWLAI